MPLGVGVTVLVGVGVGVDVFDGSGNPSNNPLCEKRTIS